MSWQLQTLAISNTIILTGWWGLSLISFADEYEKNKKSGWFQEVDAAIKREAELRGPSVSHLKIYTKYIMLFKYKWLFLCCSPNNSIWSICYLVSRATEHGLCIPKLMCRLVLIGNFILFHFCIQLNFRAGRMDICGSAPAFATTIFSLWFI